MSPGRMPITYCLSSLFAHWRTEVSAIFFRTISTPINLLQRIAVNRESDCMIWSKPSKSESDNLFAYFSYIYNLYKRGSNHDCSIGVFPLNLSRSRHCFANVSSSYLLFCNSPWSCFIPSGVLKPKQRTKKCCFLLSITFLISCQSNYSNSLG